jgi:hypothetical protein
MIKTIIPVSYDLPDLDTTVINAFGSIPMMLTATDMVAIYPNMFWFEEDAAGAQHLCTTAIMGQKFPLIDTSIGVYSARMFEEIVDCKTQGDRPWHPTTKPPRP